MLALMTEGDARRLARYSWPGNVRELENVIERAAILAVGGRLRFDLPETELPLRIATPLAPLPTDRPPTETDRRARDRAELAAALALTGGRVFGPNGAAALLGLRPTTLDVWFRGVVVRSPLHGGTRYGTGSPRKRHDD